MLDKREPSTPKPRASKRPRVSLKKHLTMGAIGLIVIKELLIVHPSDMIAELLISVATDVIIRPIAAMAGIPTPAHGEGKPHE